MRDPNPAWYFLPTPGPVWGPYPRREPMRQPWHLHRSRSQVEQVRRIAQFAWRGLAEANELDTHGLSRALARALQPGGSDLDRDTARILALVAEAARRALSVPMGLSTLELAAVMILGYVAELPLGEEGAVARALASAVLGSAGAPVHVIGVDDRQCARLHTRLAPFYSLLGLASGVVTREMAPTIRSQVYRADIVHVAMALLAEDHQHDRLSLDPQETAGPEVRAWDLGPAPDLRLRGLVCAILDDADDWLCQWRGQAFSLSGQETHRPALTVVELVSRYHRLVGTGYAFSGATRHLLREMGVRVQSVSHATGPVHLPRCRLFHDSSSRLLALEESASTWLQRFQNVRIVLGSLDEARVLSGRLAARGIPHRLGAGRSIASPDDLARKGGLYLHVDPLPGSAGPHHEALNERSDSLVVLARKGTSSRSDLSLAKRGRRGVIRPETQRWWSLDDPEALVRLPLGIRRAVSRWPQALQKALLSSV